MKLNINIETITLSNGTSITIDYNELMKPTNIIRVGQSNEFAYTFNPQQTKEAYEFHVSLKGFIAEYEKSTELNKGVLQFTQYAPLGKVKTSRQPAQDPKQLEESISESKFEGLHEALWGTTEQPTDVSPIRELARELSMNSYDPIESIEERMEQLIKAQAKQQVKDEIERQLDHGLLATHKESI